jgi:hypothetical protein
MIKVLFEAKECLTGNGFRVHLDEKLTKELMGSYMNYKYYPGQLSDIGARICKQIEEIPGIDREIMVSTYSLETGIAYPFDPGGVIEQVLEVIREATGEAVEASYRLPPATEPRTLSNLLPSSAA